MISREIHVIGSGPAGATAAHLLASWGHAVTVFSKSPGEHPLAVSVPPSTAKLFEAIDVTEDVARADFIRSTGNTVWWGNRDARTEPFAAGQRGWQLVVQELSDLLTRRAVASGARIGGTVDSASPPRFVLDCTGRSGVLARSKQLRQFDGRRTIALIGEWRSERGWSVPDNTHTLIESYDAGWAWSVPTRRGTRHIAAMVDPQRSGLQRDGSPLETYRAEIRKTRAFRALTEDAALESGPWGWDASPYHAREYTGDGWALVGDAASFIDPLSSAGVKKALASAWLASVVVHTSLTTPQVAAEARAFYASREREMHRRMSREAERALAAAAGDYAHPFWEGRGAEDDERTDAAEVREAFESLKRREAFHARRGETLRIEPRPCVRGNLIVLEPHLLDQDGAAVQYVHGVDVVTLVSLAPSERSIPNLYDAVIRHCGPTPLPDFLLALATAVSRRWLVAE